MVIGFMGKGGSGKTTISSRVTHFLVERDFDVLAIDADHNMDLLYNLGIHAPFPYLGGAMSELRSYTGLQGNGLSQHEEHFSEVVMRSEAPLFHLSPPDAFTSKFSFVLGDHLRVMAAGPHTEDVLLGIACSHFLTTPLKVYLPLLQLGPQQAVVMDCTAGMDAAGTGTATGCDFIFICTEPTIHGLKTARQISETLRYYAVPFAFILNKVKDESADRRLATLDLGEAPKHEFTFNPDYLIPNTATTLKDTESFAGMLEEVRRALQDQTCSRFQRSKEKFLRNREAERQRP